MAAGRIVLSQYFPARDRSGRLVSGALLYVYTNGTTTKASIYYDEVMATPRANPVEANASGQFPVVWASDAATYTLSITGPDGESIGNPSVFDNYSVSTDADTASVALAEAAASTAETAEAAAVAALADVLAVVATGSDAAAIAARAAKAANLSDLEDAAEARTNIGADLAANVNFIPATTTPATRSVQTKQREQPISPADSGDTTTALRLTDAIRAAQNGAGSRVFIPAGEYNADIAPLDISEEMRGKPISIVGAGSGEPFVAQGLQEGSRIIGVDATSPVVDLKHKVAQQGAGSIDFRKFFIRGTKNAGVPVFRSEGLQGINFIAELGILQSGVGDGVHLGNVTTSTFENTHVLGASWASGGDIARTGVGVSMVLDQDCALGRIDKITSRGFDQAYELGLTGPSRALAYTASDCEVSYCADGFNVGTYTEAFHLDTPYIEGCFGKGALLSGKAPLITNPYIVLDFEQGIEFQGQGGTVVGGYIGLATTGSKGVVIGAASGGGSIFGTQFVWGGGSAGTNVGHGVHIEAQADPVVNLFTDFRGSWTGTGTTARLLDESYSSAHGGSTGGIGFGALGFLYRRTQGGGPLPCLSRGAINLKVDSASLSESQINGSGTLTISNSSVQYLTPTVAKEVIRFAAPNLPDKTGFLIIDGGNVTITPSSSYIRGLIVPEIFAAGEIGVVAYQTVPGVNGLVWITNVWRPKPHLYTVATLPSAVTAGAGFVCTVSDALTPVLGDTVVGGGAVHLRVTSNGTNWKVG